MLPKTALALACAVLLTTAGAVSPASASITVYGDVYCSNTGAPAEGVKVTAICTATFCERIPTIGYTNSYGHFSIYVDQCPFCAFSYYYEVTVGNDTHCCRMDGIGSSWDAGTWTVGCNYHCFVAGTPITMADGATKPIEKIEAGDLILAYDEATKEMKPDEVLHVHDPVVENSYLIINDRIRVTKEHPFMSNGEWTPVRELKVGDVLARADGTPEMVTKIELVLEPVKVFNFSTNPYETFVADGIIVHNKPLEENEEEMDP